MRGRWPASHQGTPEAAERDQLEHRGEYIHIAAGSARQGSPAATASACSPAFAPALKVQVTTIPVRTDDVLGAPKIDRSLAHGVVQAVLDGIFLSRSWIEIVGFG